MITKINKDEMLIAVLITAIVEIINRSLIDIFLTESNNPKARMDIPLNNMGEIVDTTTDADIRKETRKI